MQQNDIQYLLLLLSNVDDDEVVILDPDLLEIDDFDVLRISEFDFDMFFLELSNDD